MWERVRRWKGRTWIRGRVAEGEGRSSRREEAASISRVSLRASASARRSSCWRRRVSRRDSSSRPRRMSMSGTISAG